MKERVPREQIWGPKTRCKSRSNVSFLSFCCIERKKKLVHSVKRRKLLLPPPWPDKTIVQLCVSNGS